MYRSSDDNRYPHKYHTHSFYENRKVRPRSNIKGPVPTQRSLGVHACITPAIRVADIGSVGDVSWDGTPCFRLPGKATWENVLWHQSLYRSRRRRRGGYVAFNLRRTLIGIGVSGSTENRHRISLGFPHWFPSIGVRDLKDLVLGVDSPQA